MAWKRAFDVVIGAVFLAALLPLLAALAVLVRLDSPGPAFFLQERIGREGRPFLMWKLRSMRLGSSDSFHRLATQAWFAGRGGKDGFKPDHDPRVTRVGRFLRRTCLDELPQLINVLKGDMSLVGPRPAIAYELDLYETWYFERQRLRPGVTGLWQVSGRKLQPARVMMEFDVHYARHASLALDLKILALTAACVTGRIIGRNDGWN